MANLTRAEFRSEVQLACRNLPDTDPYYGAGAAVIDRFINRARNRLIRMAIGPKGSVDLFPELKKDWTIGPTVAGANSFDRRTVAPDSIYINKITKQESGTVPTGGPPPLGNWAVIREKPVEFKAREQFDFLARDSATGYASIWTRHGWFIFYYPTTDADHVDYFRAYGVGSETMASSGAAFICDEFWDDPTVMLAAAIIQERRGWFARSRELMTRVHEILEETSDTSALEGLGQSNTLSVIGAPTRATVYRR